MPTLTCRCTRLALLALLLSSCASQHVPVDRVGASVYLRRDTDDITVLSPRVSASTTLGDASGLEVAYTMDAWTGASIDIVTAASPHVDELRHELSVGGYHELDGFTVSGGYRHSRENDYISNGGVANLSVDMADKNTTLAFSAFGGNDLVGRAGDPGFGRAQQSLGGRVALTQVLNPKALVQLSVERTRVGGYQSSPYRFVGIGGDGICAGSATLCIPEVHPGVRNRNALVTRGRHALGDHGSLGLMHRFYFDDWGVQSQTLELDHRWVLSDVSRMELSYRYYTQREASFYRVRYLQQPDLPYVTRDRELSTLYYNRLTGSLERDWSLPGGSSLNTALRAGPTYYRYPDFVGLSHVWALESTVSMTLTLD